MFHELYDEVKQPVLFTLPLTKFEINDIQRYGKSHALYVVLAFRLLELSICDRGSANPFRVSCTNSWKSRAAQFRRRTAMTTTSSSPRISWNFNILPSCNHYSRSRFAARLPLRLSYSWRVRHSLRFLWNIFFSFRPSCTKLIEAVFLTCFKLVRVCDKLSLMVVLIRHISSADIYLCII